MLIDGYGARPATLDDAASVAAVIAACQVAEFGASEVNAADVQDDWAGIDLGTDTLVLERAGVVRAFADLVVRPGLVSIYGYVHPAEECRGLGSHLASWGEERAAAQSEATSVRHYVVSTNRRAVTLLEGRGYEFQRSVLWLQIDLDGAEQGGPNVNGATAPRGLPPGTRLRTYRGASDEPAVYHAFEAGSLDMNGRVPNTPEQWLASAATKDRDLFFIAQAGAEVIGLLIASVSEVEADPPGDGTAPPKAAVALVGHVDSLRVVRAWRRRGIGAALLATAFEALRDRGATRVGLSVDAASPTGAPNLYLAAGMRETRRYLVMERVIGGRELAAG